MDRSVSPNVQNDPEADGDAEPGEPEGDEARKDVGGLTPEAGPAAEPDSIARLEADLERAKEAWRAQVERGAGRRRRRLRFRRAGTEDRQAVAQRQALSNYEQAWQALERARAEAEPRPDATAERAPIAEREARQGNTLDGRVRGRPDTAVKAADPPAAAAAPQPNPVSLSSADFEQLRDLGMSRTQANRVIRYRDKHGDFSEVEELREVGGFPPALLERIEPRITP